MKTKSEFQIWMALIVVVTSVKGRRISEFTLLNKTRSIVPPLRINLKNGTDTDEPSHSNNTFNRTEYDSRILFSKSPNEITTTPSIPNISRVTKLTEAPVLNPILNQVLNPVLNPQLNPVLNSQFNPVLNSKLNPVLNPQLNPVLNPQLNPVLNPQLNPVLNPQLNPVLNPQLNPVLNPQSNPVLNPQSNPVLNPQLNQVLIPQLNPILNSPLNPVLNPKLNLDLNEPLNPIVFNHFLNPTLSSKTIPNLRQDSNQILPNVISMQRSRALNLNNNPYLIPNSNQMLYSNPSEYSENVYFDPDSQRISGPIKWQTSLDEVSYPTNLIGRKVANRIKSGRKSIPNLKSASDSGSNSNANLNLNLNPTLAEESVKIARAIESGINTVTSTIVAAVKKFDDFIEAIFSGVKTQIVRTQLKNQLDIEEEVTENQKNQKQVRKKMEVPSPAMLTSNFTSKTKSTSFSISSCNDYFRQHLYIFCGAFCFYSLLCL